MHHHTHRQASKVQVASHAVLESSDSLCGIFDMWQSKCRPGLLPSRADLTHEDLQPWFGYIILLNVVDRGEDFRYRLFGSRIAEELGFDMSGKLVSEHPNRDFMPHYLDAHRMAVEQRVAMVTPAWPELDTVVLRRRLIMPLAADGHTARTWSPIFAVASPQKWHSRITSGGGFWRLGTLDERALRISKLLGLPFSPNCTKVVAFILDQ